VKAERAARLAALLHDQRTARPTVRVRAGRITRLQDQRSAERRRLRRAITVSASTTLDLVAILGFIVSVVCMIRHIGPGWAQIAGAVVSLAVFIPKKE
jgi:hypothetical protein